MARGGGERHARSVTVNISSSLAAVVRGVSAVIIAGLAALAWALILLLGLAVWSGF